MVVVCIPTEHAHKREVGLICRQHVLVLAEVPVKRPFTSRALDGGTFQQASIASELFMFYELLDGCSDVQPLLFSGIIPNKIVGL